MSEGLSIEEQVVGYLQQMRIPDTEKVREAEAFLKVFLANPESVNVLIKIMTTNQDNSIRQMSALFLRKVIMDFWDSVLDDTKTSFKSTILQCLRNEQHNLVRKAICGVISYIAHEELSANKEWDDIVNDIRTYSQSSNVNDRIICQLFIFALYINLDKMFSSEEICQLLSVGLQDPESFDVRCMAFKATCALLEIVAEYDTLDEYTSLVSPFFSVLQILVNNQDVPLCTRAFSCLSITASSSYPFFDSIISSIIQFTIEICANVEMEDSIRTSACDFLASVVETRASIILNLNLLDPIINLCVHHISDGADPDGNDEDAPCISFEPVLDNCAKAMPAKITFDLVCQYAVPLLTNDSWEARRAGIQSLMVITENTTDMFAYDITNICTKIRPLLGDPCKAVVKKTSYFFSEIVQYLGSFVLKKYSPLLEDVITLLNRPDEFNQNCGLYILECLGQFFDSISYEPILQQMIPRLFSIFNSTQDIHMKSLIMSSCSSIITAVEEGYQPYVDATATICYQYMQVNDPAYNALRGRCTEVITTLLCYCITPNLEVMLPQIVAIVSNSFANPELLDDYSFYFFSSLCYNYSDMLMSTYTNVLVFTLSYLQDATEFEQIVKDGADKEFGSIMTSNENSQNDETVESSVFIGVKPEICNIKTSAMNFINTLCDDIPSLIVSNYEVIMKIFISFTEHMSDKIRETSFKVLSSLISVLYRQEDHDEYEPSYPAYTALPSVTAKYMSLINQVAISCILNDKDIDAVSNAITLLTNCLDEFGSASMQNHLDDYTTLISALLLKKAPCQCNVDGDDNYNNELMDNEDDQVTCDGMRLLASLIEVCGVSNTVKQLLPEIWNLVKVYLDTNKDSYYIETAVQVGCTILEVYKDATFVINDICNVINYAMNSDNEILMSNIAYFIGLLFTYYPNEYVTDLNIYVSVLITIVNNNSVSFEGRAKDNAVSALCRVETAFPDHASNVIIPAILDNMPLVQDTKENENVFNTLFTLLQNNNTIVNQNLAKVFTIFSLCLGDQTNVDEEIQNHIKSYMNYAKTLPTYSSIISVLPVDISKRLN